MDFKFYQTRSRLAFLLASEFFMTSVSFGFETPYAKSMDSHPHTRDFHPRHKMALT